MIYDMKIKLTILNVNDVSSCPVPNVSIIFILMKRNQNVQCVDIADSNIYSLDYCFLTCQIIIFFFFIAEFGFVFNCKF